MGGDSAARSTHSRHTLQVYRTCSSPWALCTGSFHTPALPWEPAGQQAGVGVCPRSSAIAIASRQIRSIVGDPAAVLVGRTFAWSSPPSPQPLRRLRPVLQGHKLRKTSIHPRSAASAAPLEWGQAARKAVKRAPAVARYATKHNSTTSRPNCPNRPANLGFLIRATRLSRCWQT